MATLTLEIDPRQATRGAQNVGRALDDVGRSAEQANRRGSRAMRQLGQSLNRALFGSSQSRGFGMFVATQLSHIRRALRATFSTRPITAFYRAIRSGAQGARSAISKVFGAMKRHPVMLGIGAASGGFGLASVLGAAGELKQVQTTFGVVSKDAAADMKWLRGEAERLGGSFIESAKAYSGFAIAAETAGASTEEAKRVFIATAEASAVLGKSAADQRGILLALEQMYSKGNVSAEELRGQLGERLPGAFNVMARALGVSTAKLNDMLQQGLVPAKEALPRFAAELNRTFGPQLTASLGTFQKASQRLKNAFFDLRAELGSPIADALTPVLERIKTVIRQVVDSGAAKGIGQAIGDGIEYATEKISQFIAIIGGIERIGSFLSGLGTTLRETMTEWTEAAEQGIKDLIRLLKELVQELKRLTDTLGGYKEKIDGVMDSTPVKNTISMWDKLRGVQEQTGTEGEAALKKVDTSAVDATDSIMKMHKQITFMRTAMKEIAALSISLAAGFAGAGSAAANIAAAGLRGKTTGAATTSTPPPTASTPPPTASTPPPTASINLTPFIIPVEKKVVTLQEKMEKAFGRTATQKLLGDMTAIWKGSLTEIVRDGEDKFSRLTMIVNEFENRLANRESTNGDAFQFGFTKALIDAGNETQRMAKLGENAFSSLENGMSTALGSIVTGTKDAGDAFRDMTVSILSDIAQLLAREAVSYALGGSSTDGKSLGGLFSSLFGGIKRSHTGEGPSVGAGERLRIVRPTESIMTPSQLAAQRGAPQVIQITNNTTIQDGNPTTSTTFDQGQNAQAAQFNDLLEKKQRKMMVDLAVDPESPFYRPQG